MLRLTFRLVTLLTLWQISHQTSELGQLRGPFWFAKPGMFGQLWGKFKPTTTRPTTAAAAPPPPTPAPPTPTPAPTTTPTPAPKTTSPPGRKNRTRSVQTGNRQATSSSVIQKAIVQKQVIALRKIGSNDATTNTRQPANQHAKPEKTAVTPKTSCNDLKADELKLRTETEQKIIELQNQEHSAQVYHCFDLVPPEGTVSKLADCSEFLTSKRGQTVTEKIKAIYSMLGNLLSKIDMINKTC